MIKYRKLIFWPTAAELMLQYTIKLLKQLRSVSDLISFNSDDDQRQLVEIFVLDILSIKLKYVS